MFAWSVTSQGVLHHLTSTGESFVTKVKCTKERDLIQNERKLPFITVAVSGLKCKAR